MLVFLIKIYLASTYYNHFVLEAFQNVYPAGWTYPNLLIPDAFVAAAGRASEQTKIDHVVKAEADKVAEQHHHEIELKKLASRLEEMKYKITYDETLVEYLSKVGFDELYGARPLKRAIQDKVEDLLSEEVLTGKLICI